MKIINDVSGLEYDPETVNTLKKYKIPFILQHTQGAPENMQKKIKYKNELLDIYDFFEQKISFLKKIGIKHNNIIIDPGIGFGKNLKHNINLISNISIFHSLGFPILVGNSRKRFIKEISGKNDTKDRIGGTVASSIYLMMQGVQILRIHDVNELLQSIKVFKEIIQNIMTKKYFGTDGIRGAINSKNINGDMFFKFGLASGTYFQITKKKKTNSNYS